MSRRLFTSESVTEGHPDKIADAISDAILDALLEQDRRSRVAVETMITTGQVHVAGEVTTEAYADIPTIVRDKILEIGYQRNYNPIYRSAFDGVMKTGVLGDIYSIRLSWARNGNWRRNQTPPSKDFDASKWGYPSFDHLWN